MDPFAAALDAAANATRGTKRPRHNELPDQPKQLAPYARSEGLHGPQWSDQAPWSAAGHDANQPAAHSRYGTPPPAEAYGQFEPHGQPYHQNHQVGMYQQRNETGACYSCRAFGGPVGPSPCAHTAYAEYHSGSSRHLWHPGYPGYPSRPHGHHESLNQPTQPAQSIHSYRSRMAYGSGLLEDARRDPSHHGRRADRGQKLSDEVRARKRQVPQSHKVFIGGLPQNVTEGELLKFFANAAGPVADVLILRDFTTGRHRGFAFVMFEQLASVAKVVAPQVGNTRLLEFRPGKYIEAKHAEEKDNIEHGAEDAVQRASTKPKLKNVCMDCGRNNPKFCMPNENKKRWCSDCAQKNHPEAVKTRTMKEKKQREDRCEVFQWARSVEPVRCAYWIVAECPNLKAGKVCDRIHECKNCGFTDTKDNQVKGCPNCPSGWWRKRSAPGATS